MREIPLARGYVAWVDDEDFDKVSAHRWYTLISKRNVAAVRVGKRPARAFIYMHRVIMGVERGVDVDHKEHRSDRVVDNRRQNLRVATRAENMRNQRKTRSPCSSIFKGVTWHKRMGHWMAQIQGHYLGLFDSEANAAHVYDLEAVKRFGEFALTNFPVPGSQRWLFGES